jgi:hypothetical protein
VLVLETVLEAAEKVAAEVSRRWREAASCDVYFAALIEALYAWLRRESNTGASQGRRNEVVGEISGTIDRLARIRDAARAVPEIAPPVAAAHRLIDGLRGGNAAAKFEVQ